MSTMDPSAIPQAEPGGGKLPIMQPRPDVVGSPEGEAEGSVGTAHRKKSRRFRSMPNFFRKVLWNSRILARKVLFSFYLHISCQIMRKIFSFFCKNSADTFSGRKCRPPFTPMSTNSWCHPSRPARYLGISRFIRWMASGVNPFSSSFREKSRIPSSG